MDAWTKVFSAISYQERSNQILLSNERWEEVAQDLRIPAAPYSYRDYHARFGYGSWGDEFLILPPVSIDGSSTILSFARDEWPEYAHGLAGGDALVVFALLPAECYLAWKRGEFDGCESLIYVVDVLYDKVIHASRRLDEFLLDQWIEHGLDRTCPREGAWTIDLDYIPIRPERSGR